MGTDKKGIVASFTNLIFKNGGNIEAINQNVNRGLFGMQLQASFERSLDEKELSSELRALGKKLDMEVGVHYQETGRELNLAVMVTKESRCLEQILDAQRNRRLKVRIPVVIGSENTLHKLATENGIPFFAVDNQDREREKNEFYRSFRTATLTS